MLKINRKASMKMMKLLYITVLAIQFIHAADDKKEIDLFAPASDQGSSSVRQPMNEEQLHRELFNRFMERNIFHPKLPTFEELIDENDEEEADKQFIQIANLTYAKAKFAHNILIDIQGNREQIAVPADPAWATLRGFSNENNIPLISEEMFACLLRLHLKNKHQEFLLSWQEYIKSNPESEFYGHFEEVKEFFAEPLEGN